MQQGMIMGSRLGVDLHSASRAGMVEVNTPGPECREQLIGTRVSGALGLVLASNSLCGRILLSHHHLPYICPFRQSQVKTEALSHNVVQSVSLLMSQNQSLPKVAKPRAKGIAARSGRESDAISSPALASSPVTYDMRADSSLKTRAGRRQRGFPRALQAVTDRYGRSQITSITSLLLPLPAASSCLHSTASECLSPSKFDPAVPCAWIGIPGLNSGLDAENCHFGNIEGFSQGRAKISA